MRVLWLLLVIFHMWVVIGNLCSFFVVPFLTPWYIALPICSFIFLVSFSKEIKCPLTNWENAIRMKLGKKKIGGFIGYYVVKPIRKCLK
tara:strand:+ start:2818 stop:3084 length:267 start_codon:yes stop_codon:yes gene_type:complete